MYEDILPEHYDSSYGNPAYACACLGEDYGQALGFLYGELRGALAYVDVYKRQVSLVPRRAHKKHRRFHEIFCVLILRILRKHFQSPFHCAFVSDPAVCGCPCLLYTSRCV